MSISKGSVSVQHMSHSFPAVRMEVVRVFIARSLAVLVLSVLGEEMTGLSPCDFPAIYNFGDSNSDTGGLLAAFYLAGQPSGETFFNLCILTCAYKMVYPIIESSKYFICHL